LAASPRPPPRSHDHPRGQFSPVAKGQFSAVVDTAAGLRPCHEVGGRPGWASPCTRGQRWPPGGSTFRLTGQRAISVPSAPDSGGSWQSPTVTHAPVFKRLLAGSRTLLVGATHRPRDRAGRQGRWHRVLLAGRPPGTQSTVLGPSEFRSWSSPCPHGGGGQGGSRPPTFAIWPGYDHLAAGGPRVRACRRAGPSVHQAAGTRGQRLAGCWSSHWAATVAGFTPCNWARWFMWMRSRVLSWAVTASIWPASAGP
jgi:hypothetical protein